MIRVLDASFAGTSVDLKGAPKPGGPEIAWVGRSNVGKSSMINALVGRKKLVRVSNTPGRTRTLNFFDVRVAVDGEERFVRFVDLPGYGYAKVPRAERGRWDAMAAGYLEKGQAVRAVVAIVDAEIGPTEDDLATLDYLREVAKRILVVATKIDRLAKAHRKPKVLEIARRLELPLEAVLPFSATEGIGNDAVWEALMRAV